MAQRDEIARLEAMHAANPEGRVFAHLAEAYRKAGDYDRAREVLQAGLQRHPQYASAHVVFGRVLLDVADRPAADASFRRVLELDPHNMVALRARADIAHENGDDMEALRFYRELISLDPSDEQAVLRIAEIESRPADAAKPITEEAPAEAGFGEVDLAAPAPSAVAPAPIEETPPVEYGEASLPPAGETVAEPAHAEPAHAEPFEASDFGAVSIDTSAAAAASAPAGGDVDLGLGGALEPTDLGSAESTPVDLPMPAPPEPEAEPAASAADGFAGVGAFEPQTETVPDAVVDLSSMGGHFALPQVEEPDAADADLPGFDEIAADATPEPMPASEPMPPAPAEPIVVPTAPADEPAPAPGPSFAAEPDIVDTKAEFDALWTTYDDGAAAALPDVGPELITETIGDLYSQQGLHDRAADVYARLLEGRAGDEALQAKLDAARAAATTGAAAVPATPEPLPIPRPTPLVDEPSAAAAEPEPAFEQPAAESTPTEVPDVEPTREPEPVGLPDFGAEPEPAPFDLPALVDAGADPFDLPPVSAASETDPFGLPPLADEPAVEAAASMPWDAPAQQEPVPAPESPRADEPTSLPEPAPEADSSPIVPIEDLGLEPAGGDLLVQPATPAQTAEVESVESAWTGGAGAAGGTDSPFGWAEPETTPAQATIGEYFDRLIAWSPPAAEPGQAPEPSAVESAPAAPEPAQAVDSSAVEPAPAPAAPEAAPPPASAFAAPATSFDDIDALFGEVSGYTPIPTDPSSLIDDIEALFGTPAPLDTATPAAASPAEPPMLPPAVQEPEIAVDADPQVSPAPVEEAGFAWDPFAELAPQAPAPAPTPPIAPAAPVAPSVADTASASSGDGFEWDPFAELPQTEEPAAAPAAETAPESTEDGDDDEDIDMFRAWLQSLKR